MTKLTVVMYHYVRDLNRSSFPRLKAMLDSEFREQVSYLGKYYNFVTVADCLDALASDTVGSLPPNPVLLTFDDAYSDHFANVFPYLESHRIQGTFFVPVRAIVEHSVLSVNKIHFLLAGASSIESLLGKTFVELDRCRDEFSLRSNEEYFSKLAVPSRFDDKEVAFIKRLLQFGLPEEARTRILDRLFAAEVSADEVAFAQELYMSQEQLRCMIGRGMCVGGHGYDHLWLDRLPPDRQEREIDLTRAFLGQLGCSTDDWFMCYPYGGYDAHVVDLLAQRRCGMAVTTKVGIADLAPANRFTLERLDANDLPKVASADPGQWTLAARS
jgi:peptidoglycan/xylan/chitin deacetylase (PgdA/CDA1 family)